MARRPERERHFFLDGEGGRLHCVEHLPPPDLSNGKAVVLCRPIWGERIRTHRVFASLGRHLSGKGFSVVACDYHGDGNSGGATLDLSFTGMVADVKRLHAYLLETHKPRGFAVVGLRAGANCALAAAREIPGVEPVVMVEPIPDLRGDLNAGLRANLSSQMVLHKKIVKTREVLIQEVKSGVPVNIDGFIIGKEMWESFEAASPLTADAEFGGEVIVVSLAEEKGTPSDFSRFAAGFPRGRWETIKREFVWTEWKRYVPIPAIFCAAIAEYLGA